MTLPLVQADELVSFYPDSYNAFALPSNAFVRALAIALFRWRYWRDLRRGRLAVLLDRPTGHLLDVGGGRGDLGVILRRYGWRVTSIDPSQRACEEARSRGVDSVCGTLTNPPQGLGDRYDAVVFQHSLEHVINPVADLTAARERMTDQGLLLITLPNFGSWQRRAFAANWFHLDVPRHRTHFTQEGLEALMRRSGFDEVHTSTSTSADGLPMSLQYVALGRPIGVAAGRYLAAITGIATAPLIAAVSKPLGGGDVLHGRGVRPSRLGRRL
jgi:SAM-dependent methyltransferase